MGEGLSDNPKKSPTGTPCTKASEIVERAVPLLVQYLFNVIAVWDHPVTGVRKSESLLFFNRCEKYIRSNNNYLSMS